MPPVAAACLRWGGRTDLRGPLLMSDDAAADGQSRAIRLLDLLQKAQTRLAGAALVLMMMVTVADVAMRYLLNRPLHGSYDLVEAMLVIVVFHGMAAGFFRRANIVIDIVDTLVGARLTAVLIRISDLLSLGALAIFAWAMAGPARQAFDYGDLKIDLGLPVYILWLVALTGMAGTILCALGVLIARAAAPNREGHP
jgi:TRAP-type C4-dicarboxylate transport system permease small subunit